MGHLFSDRQAESFRRRRGLGPNGCVPWLGYRNADGYGKVNLNGRIWNAHRAIYTDVHGPIPDGLVVRHTCDNAACVNIDHLVLCTDADNAADKAQRRRSRTKLTDEQVRIVRAAPGRYRDIAASFGISVAAVCLLKQRQRRLYGED
jgi:hypothetical protein